MIEINIYLITILHTNLDLTTKIGFRRLKEQFDQEKLVFLLMNGRMTNAKLVFRL